MSPQHVINRYPQPINHSTIFKTFDSDIDKWTAKIGILGKSFNELGTAVDNAFKAVIDNIDNFDENVGFWESLKNNLFSKNDSNKDWIKNSLGEIISKENIDSYIKELDLESAKNKIKEIFDWQEDINNGETTWNEYFDTCKGGNEYIIDLIKNTNDLSKLTGEDLVKANQQAREATIAHNAALQQQTLGAKAATVATKALAIAGNMIAMWAISEVISGLYELSQVSEDVAKSAQELGNSFKSTSSDIDDYKTQIEELYETINDSGSSVEEVTTARKNLMTVQDELIEKFGTEKEAIDLITEAVNGQTEAFDELTKKQWQETLNEFNDSGFWNNIGNFFGGYADNVDRMLDEYEDYTASIDLSKFAGFLGNKQYQEFRNLLENKYGAEIKLDGTDTIAEISGNASEVYQKLLEIQNLSDDFEFNNAFSKDLTKLANSAKDVSEQYEDMYNQYVLYEKVFENTDYTNSFKEITDAYNEYQDAFASGDEDAISQALENYSNIITTAMNEALENGDEDVVNYFQNMYPALQSIVEQWKFKTTIIPTFDTSGLEGKTQADVLEMLQTDGIQEGEETFNSIIESAIEYGIITDDNAESIQKLLDLLVEWGVLQGEISDSDFNNETDNSLLSISSTIDQLNDQIKPAFDSLKSAWQDIFTDDGFKLNAIDLLSTYDSIKSTLDDMSELGLSIDYSAFENFVQVLNNTESTEQNVKDAFNELATSITEAGLSGTEDFEVMKAALEDLGVVNEDIVAFQALAENTDALKESGLDLANASYAQIEAFAQEKLSAEDTAQGIAVLLYQQMLVSDNPLDTLVSIQALANLDGKAAETAEILTELAQIMARISQLQSFIENGTGDMSLVEATLSGLQKRAESLKTKATVSFETEVDFNDVGGGTSAASSAGSDAGDAYVEAFEDELSKLDTLKEQGKITEKEYLDYLRALYEKYFKDIDGYAEEFAENQYNYLSGMKSLYESALSGITSMLDKQISAYEDQKDVAVDALEDQKDAAIDALEAEKDARIEVLETQKEQFQTQIDLIDKQISAKEKVIDAIQDEIDAMEEANDERERQIALQQAQYNLERMQNQRTILQYSEEKGIHYVQDTSGIRDAKQDVEDAEFEIEIANKEKQISLIEKEVELLEEKKDSINDQIDLLDDQIDKTTEYYDELISNTEEMYDQMIDEAEKYWDNLIKNMEDYKSRWEELSELEENAKLMATLKELGITTEDILGMSEDAFSKFKDEYVGILADIYSGNDTMTNALADSLGTTTDKLGSYIQSTQGYIDSLNGSANELQPVADALNNTADGMSNLSTSASDANANVSETATSVGTVADNVNAAADNVGTLKENFSEVNTLVTDEQTAFDTLKQKIDEVIEAVNQKTKAIQNEQTAVGIAASSEMADFLLLKEKILEVKESLDSIGESVSTLDAAPINNLTNAFQSLYDKLLLVSAALGVGMEASKNGAVSSITSAIQALNEISLEEGIIAQFDNLKTAIDSVSSAIGGGGGESSGGESQGGNSGSSKGGESGSKGSESGGSSLTSAITEMGETASAVIGEPEAEGDGTVIGEFGSLKTAVDDVSAAIGSGESEGGENSKDGESDNLIGSITNLGEQTEEILGDSGGDGVIGRFEEFESIIEEANEHVTGISDGLKAIDGQEVECTITVNIKTNGSLPSAIGAGMNLGSATYDAKYLGNAHIEGTALASGNWAVQSDEKQALVGEEGFEIIVRNGRFFTVGNNGAEMTNIQKGDIVFNHEQSKNLLKNGHISGRGKAYADGTVGGGKFLTPDGHILCPLQPGDKEWGMMQKFDAYLKSIDGNLEKLTPNSFYEQNRQMHEVVNQINNSNIVNKNQPAFTINGGINVTCPGVTSKEVMSQVGIALEKELSGMALKAYQKVNITR